MLMMAEMYGPTDYYANDHESEYFYAETDILVEWSPCGLIIPIAEDQCESTPDRGKVEYLVRSGANWFASVIWDKPCEKHGYGHSGTNEQWAVDIRAI